MDDLRTYERTAGNFRNSLRAACGSHLPGHCLRVESSARYVDSGSGIFAASVRWLPPCEHGARGPRHRTTAVGSRGWRLDGGHGQPVPLRTVAVGGEDRVVRDRCKLLRLLLRIDELSS